MIVLSHSSEPEKRWLAHLVRVSLASVRRGDRFDDESRFESERLLSLARRQRVAPLLHRARLVFLAFVGRTAAVDAIIGPSGLLGPAMPEAVRHFWSGLARLNAGDRPGARERLGEAALPSLAIVAVGILPLVVLSRAIARARPGG